MNKSLSFDFIKRKYNEGEIGINEINIAVTKKLITQEEANLIINV